MTLENKQLRKIVNQDGAAILHIKSGKLSTLNATGAIVWQALERGEPVETISENLARMTGEPIESVRNDVVSFMDALRKQEILPC